LRSKQMATPATPVFKTRDGERTPGAKLLLTILVGFLLAIPLFAMYLLVYDRQSQSETAGQSIVEGWGGAQVISGPVLVIPWQRLETTTAEENGKSVTRTAMVQHELALSPLTALITSDIKPERRKRSIYEAVVYETNLGVKAHYALPADLVRYDVDREALRFDRAELRFGLRDTRGIFGVPPRITVAGQVLTLQPGHGLGATSGAGFFTWLDATALKTGALDAELALKFRGNRSLTLAPRAGDTTWTVTSTWPNPSFQGGFLPTTRKVTEAGFTATYRVGNLALGQSLVNAEEGGPTEVATAKSARSFLPEENSATGTAAASIDLIQPIDLYDQVNRATKYGFLFIGFTFAAFLMFDVIGGVRVSAVEYLLVGAGLILFFALLLAFAEVIGFTLAYLIASAAIIGLITAYSAAILKSWRRAFYVAGLLTGLYAVLYILLSLEAYSLLIGSLMLFAALAAVMYVTRNLDWGVRRGAEGEP
jgi:inner membrane protein